LLNGSVCRRARVLEVGPGSGFFSVALARCVPEGHLALLDLQPAFLVRAQRKLTKAGLRNFNCTPGNACDLPFPDGDFDVAVFVTVLGEITEPAACLREVLRVLKPGGLLSITELRLDPDFVPREHVDLLVDRAGFEFVEAWGPPRSYTAHFRRPA
jgi:ubiquinone/menaquinone biosynthesis C-methylase UbiE